MSIGEIKAAGIHHMGATFIVEHRHVDSDIRTLPMAPAFMRIAPPIVPGIPDKVQTATPLCGPRELH